MTFVNQDGRREGTDRYSLLRWFAASATLGVPQAAGPVAFSLVALSLTGETTGGAAMILTMTVAQVAGAIPLTRLGRGTPSARMLRLLIIFRTAALASLALCVWFKVPFVWLVVFAAAAGVVNGAAYGHLRSLLNHFTPPARLPRALGIAATLNETTFVLAPVAASALAAVSPVLAVAALALLGSLPSVLVPNVDAQTSESVVVSGGNVLSPAIALWLACAVAGGAAVAGIEIGAVAMAISFGYTPGLAILFTVPLCIASVVGGIWVSVRNSYGRKALVVMQMSLMAVGTILAAVGHSLTVTITGAVCIGIVLAPLATHYSLALDSLAPSHRKPEVFALLRTANALGIILASGFLTMTSLSTALILVAAFMVTVTLTVAVSSPTTGGASAS